MQDTTSNTRPVWRALSIQGPSPFSGMSAISLARWVREEAREKLGLNKNRWAQLIEIAGGRARQLDIDSESRAIFREAALEAIAMARQIKALPKHHCDRFELSLRVGFMRRGSWDQEWLRIEAEQVFIVFLNAMPVDIEFIEVNSGDWGKVNREIVNTLAANKYLFGYLKRIRPFLGTSSEVLADR